jgi:hypothetical protein
LGLPTLPDENFSRSNHDADNATVALAQVTLTDSEGPRGISSFKALTDPFNDAIIYAKAPLYLMRGELIDPMGEVEPEAHRA